MLRSLTHLLRSLTHSTDSIDCQGVGLVAEHGLYFRAPRAESSEWELLLPAAPADEWKQLALPILEARASK